MPGPARRLSPHADAADRKLAQSAHVSVLMWLVVSLVQQMRAQTAALRHRRCRILRAYFTLLVLSPLFLLFLLCKDAGSVFTGGGGHEQPVIADAAAGAGARNPVSATETHGVPGGEGEGEGEAVTEAQHQQAMI